MVPAKPVGYEHLDGFSEQFLARIAKEAFRLGVNLVLYALCLDYKTEQAHIDYILRTRRFSR